MPGKDAVLRLLHDGRTYQEIGRELGIPPGRAYLIATGQPADASDATGAGRDGALRSHAQQLVNPREVNPTERPDVWAGVRRRAHEGSTS
jgi:hypothetical protein